MLVDDARRIAAAIEERFSVSACQGVKATVKSEQTSPKVVPTGAGRPTFTNYFIQIDDGTQLATLTLGQAAGLLEDLAPDWDPPQLFDAIRARDWLVERRPQ